MTRSDDAPPSAISSVSERTLHNPILTGFHPDPSILRVGDDYYIATSTFEWYPGVLLYHSRDLVNWCPLGGALDDTRLVDLTRCRDSAGVWAPCLSYADGLFYLVYTNVETYAGFWDTPNYITTAPDINGPWSDPVAVHSMGFDPSLFHEDGRSWLLTNLSDWRPERDAFSGIVLQEVSRKDLSLLGDPQVIFTGTEAGVTEAPHVYRRGDWYFLVTAEGGTSWEHQVTVARAHSLYGPYEVDPAGPLLTSKADPHLGLQKAGHGSLVSTPDGDWYLAHLASRPATQRGRCVLGRETALQPVQWTRDEWPQVPGGIPHEEIPAPALSPHPCPEQPEVDHFDDAVLRPEWSTLRRPESPAWVSLRERPSHLRIRGGQSPQGLLRPSLVARRVQHHRCAMDTCMEFEPISFQQMAGLTAYYNTRLWHYLRVSHEEQMGRFARVLSCDRGRVREVGEPVIIEGWQRVYMRVEIDTEVVRFSLSPDGADWITVGPELDATILSDDYAEEEHDGDVSAPGFTGAFLGLWVQDLTGTGRYADFDYAHYRQKP
ncbi:glycoside hydrolase family 43 protein [Salinactinospora qingdaonensis]|uniref:Glycoside hydrolase family 43 protein n=1 Tax=Salinactinospora qingdaonensis TaxID=702744 RepID=A0ABP7GKI3_9ACTN